MPDFSIPPHSNKDIPYRYMPWEMEDYPEAIRERVRYFFSNAGCWSMYLHGGPGSKKSSVACAALKRWRKWKGPGPDRESEFVAIYQAVDWLRDIHSPGAKARLKLMQDRKLLLIDDLGKNRGTPHVVEQFIFLLHRRYDAGAKTIITSNLDLTEFAQHIDPATSSRFQEGIILDLGDKDERKK